VDYEANVNATLLRSTYADQQEGRVWYDKANEICLGIAMETGHDTDTVAAVIAALSPRVKWDRNIRDAYNYCLAAAQGGEMPPSTAFGKCKAKAWKIATQQAQWQDVLKGPKVTSFVANLTGDLQPVTVDSWVIRLATGWAKDEVKEKEYRAIEAVYQDMAVRHGLKPAQLQAITWVTARRLGRMN